MAGTTSVFHWLAKPNPWRSTVPGWIQFRFPGSARDAASKNFTESSSSCKGSGSGRYISVYAQSHVPGHADLLCRVIYLLSKSLVYFVPSDSFLVIYFSGDYSRGKIFRRKIWAGLFGFQITRPSLDINKTGRLERSRPVLFSLVRTFWLFCRKPKHDISAPGE